jgi:hypothetical protein
VVFAGEGGDAAAIERETLVDVQANGCAGFEERMIGHDGGQNRVMVRKWVGRRRERKRGELEEVKEVK